MNSSKLINFDSDYFRARSFFFLKSSPERGLKLEPKILELITCESFGLAPKGGANRWADGVNNKAQASIKTRFFESKVKSDFQTCPEEYFGIQHNSKQDTRTAGIELIQRRQQLDESRSPREIGRQTINLFLDNIRQSALQYNVGTSYEIIVAHGFKRIQNTYMLSVFWQEYEAVDPEKLIWERESNAVAGFELIDMGSGPVKVKRCLRINGNANRCATNFIEFKNPIKYKYSKHLQIPVPDTWEFNRDQMLDEINRIEQNANILPKRKRKSL